MLAGGTLALKGGCFSMAPMNLPERIKKNLTPPGLLPRGTRIVVAVSGGVDSMVLLHLLNCWAPGLGWRLSVAHFNHQLRARAGDADERLVRTTAEVMGLACDVGRADVRLRARREKISVEMAARDLRHAFLARCARKRDAMVVMLAQHADDQVEQFFMRLMRGAGGIGLGGMMGRTVSPADHRICLIRPMLDVSKAEIVEFARINRIRFRHDASNDDIDFDRNWVRQKLLPLLQRRQPAIVKTISRSLRIVQAETDYVRKAALEWLASLRLQPRVGFKAYKDLHASVQRHVLQEQLIELGCEPDFRLVEELRCEPGRPVSVAPNKQVMRDESGRVSEAAPRVGRFALKERLIQLPSPRRSRGPARGALKLGSLELNWRVLRKPPGFSLNAKPGREYFDAERVGARLLLRHWRPGDRFQPIGMSATTKLQDWFTNRKIPAARRRELVLAATERGEIFWVEGERIAEGCKVTPKTRRLLELCWKRT